MYVCVCVCVCVCVHVYIYIYYIYIYIYYCRLLMAERGNLLWILAPCNSVGTEC